MTEIYIHCNNQFVLQENKDKLEVFLKKYIFTTNKSKLGGSKYLLDQPKTIKWKFNWAKKPSLLIIKILSLPSGFNL